VTIEFFVKWGYVDGIIEVDECVTDVASIFKIYRKIEKIIFSCDDKI
jgi:acetyl-CoA carboxylase beta subunit